MRSLQSLNYQLLHNSIECPEILSKISFSVCRLKSLPEVPKTNLLIKSPVFNMWKLVNDINNLIDINYDSLNSIIISFTTGSHIS